MVMLPALCPSLLLVSLALAGCDTTGSAVVAPTSTFEVRTDRATYAPGDTVSVTFASGRLSTVYVVSDGCLAADGNPLPIIEFERREGGAWMPFHPGYACGAVVQEPTEVEPGGFGYSQFRVGVVPVLPPGTYRYVFDAREERFNFNSRLPRPERTSNAFEVKAQPGP